ncbi:FliI/YscN family ATPase [uncultured Erythrobacter sp.]|uniref:FliI/YscN family ATPase n=1 Tax=uncultured Erythrobacter sp. TaxID=263913 RepID=UPI00263977CC|nr:FliI/YscN family ATPase [uncultured Erythrobacter sp.]
MIRASALLETAKAVQFADFTGQIIAIGQKSFSANGPLCQVGDVCSIGTNEFPPLAEVVAVEEGRVEMVPLGDMQEVRPGGTVTLNRDHSDFAVGDQFEGRAVNAFGEPIDDKPSILATKTPLRAGQTSMAKTIVAKRVETGIRAIDTLLPLAEGQRIGIFAASGVGKTTLVEQLSSRVACDKVVICLIGERGREVERLWNIHTEADSKVPVTLVAATSDEAPSVRIRAMKQALALCEYWRERGEHVVLFVDSVTRLAMALRDIGLAAGEPPALRSYTPNVFTALPDFVERCGAIAGKGAITAVFTVLSETDDVDDPIVETMRSLLDGHIVLSRKLAERGHFPAIDVRASISRVADQVLDSKQQESARNLKANVAVFEEARAMIESGIYQSGGSEEIDRAVSLWPKIQQFLMQSGASPSSLSASDGALQQCLIGGASL